MVELKGFMGKILKIDLSANNIETIPLDEDLARKFLGGAGYATAYLYPLISKDTDPLGPENILFFMTGPLMGTSAPCTGRMVCCSKSPVTGILAESNTGSYINLQIKKAGYDGIIISGKAEKPSYITIKDDDVQIKDATHLWGKKIYETTDLLKADEEWKKGRVMCIGPAGENLVKYSIIASEERALGRTGLGAVMGSKNLKAIVARGTKKIELAKPDEFKQKAKETTESVKNVFTNQVMGELGTSCNMNLYVLTGELPVKYHRTSMYPEVDDISGATLADKYLKRQRHCYVCPVGCGRVVELEEPMEGVPDGKIEGPEYETLAGFGSVMGNNDLKAIIKANFICNDLGIDTISSSGVIALLMDLKDRGVISESDVDGLNVDWGNMESVYTLLEKTAHRKGIGDLLAEGSNAVGKKFGVEQDQIATVKNSEIPYHDPRSSFGMAVAYAISPNYGASHCAADMYMTSLGQAWEDLGIDSVPAQENSPEMAIATAKLMEYRAFCSALILCVFGNPPSTSDLAELLELGTGIPCTLDDLKTFGRRILALKRLFNLKLGLSPQDEKLPKIVLTPLEGGTNEKVPDTAMLFSEFYKYENWDPETGMLAAEEIEKLGLKDYIS